MQPDGNFIKIETNEHIINSFIEEVILKPRLSVLNWSAITKQTPGLRIGYPAQHLASLITGVEGARTGARGDDLTDGTEVKSCNRIDQLDTCKDCGQKVLRMEISCSACGSAKIDRKNDSKWLLTIRSETELELLTQKIERVLLILLDYPGFAEEQFDTARIQAYEVWPKFSPNFIQICEDYYHKIYLEHIRSNPNKTPAPKNFWPESFQFYLCRPLKVFECEILDFNTAPKASINFYHPAHESRSSLMPESAPVSIFKADELDNIFDQNEYLFPSSDFILNWRSARNAASARRKAAMKELKARNVLIQSELLQNLSLRDTSKAIPHEAAYLRR